MAYYIVIKDKDNYRKLDISNMKEFTRVSKFKNGYSLEELDLFTSKFNNEVELKRCLYENNIINYDDILSDISIRIKNKDKLDKVRYDFVYSDSFKYLDIMYLKSTINILSNDLVYLNKLLSYYRNSSCNNENISKIRWILLGNDGYELNLHNVINDFITREVFKINRDTGEVSVKYKSLHDLAMFTYNYSNKRKDNKVSLLKLQKEILTGNTKTKSRKLINQIEGQMTFFK